jgi:DNA-binding transcriptional MerR regulator
MLQGLSTGQAAKTVGTTSRTLFRWIEAGLLPAPQRLQMPGHTWYLWSDRDIKRAQKLKETVKRGRKPKKKK